MRHPRPFFWSMQPSFGILRQEGLCQLGTIYTPKHAPTGLLEIVRMEAAFVVIESNDLFLTLIKVRRLSCQLWPLKMGHSALQLQHSRQKLLISIFHDIWLLMAIHINPFSKLDMSVTELVQPAACCTLSQRLPRTDIELGEDCSIYCHSKSLRHDCASQLLCQPAAAGFLHVTLAQECSYCSQSTTLLRGKAFMLFIISCKHT